MYNWENVLVLSFDTEMGGQAEGYILKHFLVKMLTVMRNTGSTAMTTEW